MAFVIPYLFSQNKQDLHTLPLLRQKGSGPLSPPPAKGL